MPDLYRITVNGGAQLGRPTNLAGAAIRILEQQDGIRHVRTTTNPSLVATVDMQRRTFVVFLHGARLDPHDHPAWAKELSSRLGLTMQETTRHDQDPGEADA